MAKTLIIIKPDAVHDLRVGEILSRFEEAGFIVRSMKMVQPSRELIVAHYPSDEDWLRSVGEKTLDYYSNKGLDALAEMGTTDSLSIGKLIKEWLIDYLTAGKDFQRMMRVQGPVPVVVAALEGPCAIEKVREICGATIPAVADKGTIRGDYSDDSPDLANKERRAIYNLIHASSSTEEADREIELWFGDELDE
ncbi:nucleoside-diphosphate kinase [Candidatus Poribacteria bacterium]|nr:nucleoside-diphosphate kinase [Candidatus Poribacteria bacterium]